MAGPQTAESKARASAKAYEWWREAVLADPGAYHPMKIARYAAGLTQAELAGQVGVNPVTICVWEQGAKPRRSLRLQIAQALGTTEAKLWG